MSKYPTPDGYFNATEMIVSDWRGVSLRVHHFIDNLRVMDALEAAGKPPVIHKGRGACSFLPYEIKPMFIAWMAFNTKEE